jgi:RNA polymerase sigma factor (TIGR02999 family)
MNQITQILNAIDRGDADASAKLLPLVYEELRKLAIARMAREAPDHTLQPTALVHEAYLRLAIDGEDKRWDSRGHFFAAAAEAMRRILIEHARRKRRARHGGGRRRVAMEDLPAPQDDRSVIDLDNALKRLAIEDGLACRVVELRQFAGLGHEQVAATLGITVYQARQKWAYARAWLRVALQADL